MIVEESITDAHDSFAVAARIPCDSKAGRNVVIVARNSFDHAQRFFCGGVDSRGRRKQRRNFHIVTNAVVNCQFLGELPRVLREESDRNVVEWLIRIADALDVRRRYAKPVRLSAVGRRNAGAEQRQAAEVHVAAKIQFEDLCFRGTQLNQVEVSAELEIVSAPGFFQNIRELESALNAVNRGVRFTTKVSEAGNIHADLIATWKRRESEVQTAARKLEAELIDGRWVDNRVVLKGGVKVARLIQPDARARILAKYLDLRGRLNTGHKRR